MEKGRTKSTHADDELAVEQVVATPVRDPQQGS
jgi:hypothetical protein